MADRFEQVDGEIDRCLLDLGVANRILIARLERQLRRGGVRRYRDPARTETVTLRIGMPCDDDTNAIKRSIGMLQGVTDVADAGAAAGGSSKDQFRVTVTSDAVDIPSLLDKVKEKLNRNVELVTTEDKKSLAAGGATATHMGSQNYRRCAIADEETKKEKPAAIAAAAAPNMAAGSSNQAPPPYAYLPFAVALVPIAGDASTMYLAPPPYPQGPPAAGYAVQAQRPSNPQRVHSNSGERCDGAGDANNHAAKKNCGDRDDEKKGSVVTAYGGGADKEADDPVLTAGGGKWKGGGKTAAADTVTAAAIGVPVHTVTAGVAGLVPVPPPSYGHGYLPCAPGRRDTGHCCWCQNNAGGPSDDAAAAAN
jgi:hypothetical protein